MTTTHYVRRRLTQAVTPARIEQLGKYEFEGYASLFNVPDNAGDIVAPGAFAASLRKRGASQVRMLYQHFAHEPIGVWDIVKEDARGLFVRGHITADVERARDVAALIRDGAIGGLSIGFRTQRATRNTNGTRTLTEIELWEVSIVTFPMLPQSQVTAIGGKCALIEQMRTAAAVFNPPANGEWRIANRKNPYSLFATRYSPTPSKKEAKWNSKPNTTTLPTTAN
jgi:HK97 family phage prohead protease